MTRIDRDDLSDKAHLYRGLSEHPSAHADPPASVVGPTGVRQEAGTSLTPLVSPQPTEPAEPRELSYDTVSPRFKRGGKGKWLLGTAAVIGAAIAYFFLPHFGFGPGNGSGGGGGGTGPSAFAPGTQPSVVAPTTAPEAMPLHLTIQNETYHIGQSSGREVNLNEAVDLAKSAKPGAPVVIDLNDTSRARAEDRLKSALEQQGIPIMWTRDGKAMTGDLPRPRSAAPSGD